MFIQCMISFIRTYHPYINQFSTNVKGPFDLYKVLFADMCISEELKLGQRVSKIVTQILAITKSLIKTVIPLSTNIIVQRSTI